MTLRDKLLFLLLILGCMVFAIGITMIAASGNALAMGGTAVMLLGGVIVWLSESRND